MNYFSAFALFFRFLQLEMKKEKKKSFESFATELVVGCGKNSGQIPYQLFVCLFYHTFFEVCKVHLKLLLGMPSSVLGLGCDWSAKARRELWCRWGFVILVLKTDVGSEKLEQILVKKLFEHQKFAKFLIIHQMNSETTEILIKLAGVLISSLLNFSSAKFNQC